MGKILMVAALAEAGTGVILLAYPPIVVRLLFGAEIVGAGVIMSRLVAPNLRVLSRRTGGHKPTGGEFSFRE